MWVLLFLAAAIVVCLVGFLAECKYGPGWGGVMCLCGRHRQWLYEFRTADEKRLDIRECMRCGHRWLGRR